MALLIFLFTYLFFLSFLPSFFYRYGKSTAPLWRTPPPFQHPRPPSPTPSPTSPGSSIRQSGTGPGSTGCSSGSSNIYSIHTSRTGGETYTPSTPSACSCTSSTVPFAHKCGLASALLFFRMHTGTIRSWASAAAAAAPAVEAHRKQAPVSGQHHQQQRESFNFAGQLKAPRRVRLCGVFFFRRSVC